MRGQGTRRYGVRRAGWLNPYFNVDEDEGRVIVIIKEIVRSE